jgi:hypothetical protein
MAPNALTGTLQAGPNWVRFTRFTPWPSHAPRDNSLCPYTPVRSNLASFCTISSAGRLRRGEIGFVSHNRSPAGHRGPPARAHFRARGPDWVRFVRKALRRPEATGTRGRGTARPPPGELGLFDASDKSRQVGLRPAFLGGYQRSIRLTPTFVVGVLFCTFVPRHPSPGPRPAP